MGIGAKHVMVILSALIIGYLPIFYFGIHQSEDTETPSIILAFSLAFLNAIINPHIYGKDIWQHLANIYQITAAHEI